MELFELDIKEVKELTSLTEANKLISQGWILLKVIEVLSGSVDLPNHTACYVLGLPRT